MITAFENAIKLINSSSTILLTMHERMDGDDGGALLAMGAQLEKMGKQVTYAIKKGVPPNLVFLPGVEKIKDEFPEANYDLLITFGCSTLSRTGNPNIENLLYLNHSERNEESLKNIAGKGSLETPRDGEKKEITIINIDHHPDNANFGTVNMVDAKKSSVAELVYDFFIWNKWPITKDIATCLLTGIVTDTGSFMHSNTQSSTLKVASELMSKGAHTHKIIKLTYKNKTPEILKAWGQAIENSYYDKEHKIIYSVLTEKDLSNFSKLPGSAFEGFTETLNTIPEAKFAMFLRQDGEIIKGSLRSDTYKNTDVSEIAHIFGGGGHKLASGFSVAGKLVKDTAGKWKVV